MDLGFVLPNNWGVDDVDMIVELAVEAERVGLDSIWVNHHVLNAGYVRDRLEDRPYYDALTLLTWCAAATSRVRVGTSVLVFPYMHPIAAAKALATLDQLSRGRLVVGVGAGGIRVESEALGVDFDSRGERVDESIAAVRALWGGQAVDFQGNQVRFSGAISSPAPLQLAPPIWIGGNSPAARRRAAHAGDGWHPMCSARSLEGVLPGFRSEVERLGRDISDVTIAPRVDASAMVGDNSFDAFEAAGAHHLVVSVGSRDRLELFDELARLGEMSAVAAGSRA